MNPAMNAAANTVVNTAVRKAVQRAARKAVNRTACRLRAAVGGHEGRTRRALHRSRRDAGMSTAEYAVGTIAACGFAAVLYKVVTSGPVSEALQQLVERALDATF